MNLEFTAAVPEIPVTYIAKAAAYYEKHMGFHLDWGGQNSSDDGGIAGISQGNCRMFLTNASFRAGYGNAAPVLIWLNVSSKKEVDELHEVWTRAGARIVSPPEDKPWNLREFTASDLDGNLFRVFYDFSWEIGARQSGS